jgi:hypothetical protein
MMLEWFHTERSAGEENIQHACQRIVRAIGSTG